MDRPTAVFRFKINTKEINTDKMPNSVNQQNFQTRFIDVYQHRCEEKLSAFLPPRDSTNSHLPDAMSYAVLKGGKRIRPLLAYATAEALSAPPKHVDAVACAVELIHAYSLVHDDLPAMDNDDLRRGQPTCHKAYDEATAILVGDALQALAFEVIADDTQSLASPQQKLTLIIDLAQACGVQGMVEGQNLDILAEGQQLGLEDLEHIHQLKTGALITVSVTLAAKCCNCHDAQVMDLLTKYANLLGLAFQVKDDILDVTTDTHILGKTQGADAALGKATYPALLGLEGAEKKLQLIHRDINNILKSMTTFLGSSANVFDELACFIIQRHY